MIYIILNIIAILISVYLIHGSIAEYKTNKDSFLIGNIILCFVIIISSITSIIGIILS